jgi:hypothetical protein
MAEILVYDKSAAMLPVGGLVAPAAGSIVISAVTVQSINTPVGIVSFNPSSGAGPVQNNNTISVRSLPIVMNSSNPYIPSGSSIVISAVTVQSIAGVSLSASEASNVAAEYWY